MILAIRILYAVLKVSALIQPDIARSEAWPTKPVRWIQSSAPGSSADIIGRILSDRLGAKWGLQVVSEVVPAPLAISLLRRPHGLRRTATITSSRSPLRLP